MPKVDAAAIAALKAALEDGDRLTEAALAALIDAIADAAEDHEHRSGAGPGSGTGDATPIANVQHGMEYARPASPLVGDVWVETDTFKFFVCYVEGGWTQV